MNFKMILPNLFNLINRWLKLFGGKVIQEKKHISNSNPIFAVTYPLLILKFKKKGGGSSIINRVLVLKAPKMDYEADLISLL